MTIRQAALNLLTARACSMWVMVASGAGCAFEPFADNPPAGYCALNGTSAVTALTFDAFHAGFQCFANHTAPACASDFDAYAAATGCDANCKAELAADACLQMPAEDCERTLATSCPAF
jgi:hypothetical protein